MAVPALDLVTNGGRIQTGLGEALICNQCALASEPTHFTYLHGYYVRGGNEEIRRVLRSIGANYSTRNKVLCPYCYSWQDYSLHDGFFRLWRSVRLPAGQLATAWAAVDRTGWTPAGSDNLIAAAGALRDGPHRPMMLAREGADGTPPPAAFLVPPPPVPQPAAPAAGAHHPGGVQPVDAARLARVEAELQRLAQVVATLQHSVNALTSR